MQNDAEATNKTTEQSTISPENIIVKQTPTNDALKQEGKTPQETGPDTRRKDYETDTEAKARRVFIGNLSFQTSWQKVKDHMKVIGNVERVHIFLNKDGRSKGCGLVEFTNPTDAERAISQLNHSILDGRDIFVRKDNTNMAKNDREIRERYMQRSHSRDRERDRYYSRSRSPYRDDRRRYHDYNRRSRSRSRSKSSRRDRERRYYERSHSRGRSYSRGRNRSYSRGRGGRSYSRGRGGRSGSRERWNNNRDNRDNRDYNSSRGYGGRHSHEDQYRDRERERERDRYRERSPTRSRSRDRNRGRDDYSQNKGQYRGYQIIVKNIPWSVTWQQLKDAFKEYGPISRADVPQDDLGKSKGYGFVRFDREKDALSAIEGMDRALINGREVAVRMCDHLN